MTSSNGTFSTLLAFCEGNPPFTGGFPSQRPVIWSSDVFFDLCLNKRLGKQSRRRWFETASQSLWRHRNGMVSVVLVHIGLIYGLVPSDSKPLCDQCWCSWAQFHKNHTWHQPITLVVILGVGSASERWCYIVMSALILGGKLGPSGVSPNQRSRWKHAFSPLKHV